MGKEASIEEKINNQMKIFMQTLGGLQNLLTFAPQLKQEQLQHRPERAFGKR